MSLEKQRYSYATPWDADADPRWHEESSGAGSTVTHSRDEIATATADMSCKQSTNFMGIAVAVETAYDNQYISANANANANATALASVSSTSPSMSPTPRRS